jgi:5-formyltetrahydrofolate cyclo-ligase
MNQQEQIAQRKKNLRLELKRRRQSIPAIQKHRIAEQTARSAMTLANKSKRVGIYHALPNEVPTQALAEALWKIGSEVYLPRIGEDRLLRFCLWERGAVLKPGKLGIPTPTYTATEIDAEDLHLIFIPLLGFDQAGHRLGMGGGYYDATLSNAPKTTKIGLAFDCQEIESVPVEEHDIRLDVVITESRILRFQQPLL